MNQLAFRHWLLAAFLAIFFAKTAAQLPAPAPPNIIIIFADDLGYGDIGCFGAHDIATPNIDALARDGARLTDFYTAQPVCSAARAALLTGCYSNRVGIHQALMPRSGVGLNPTETTLADMLRAQGYATAIFGKWHLGDAPECMPNQQGFDEFWGIPYSNDMWPRHPQQGTVFDFKPLPLFHNARRVGFLNDQTTLTTDIARRSVRFIRKHRREPFFLYVAHPMPHVPLFVSKKFRGKSQRGLYGDVVMEIDWSVGQMLKALKKNGLDSNTLVIFTSDNGPWLAYGNHSGSAGALREGKGTVWEGGVREPCAVRFPGKIAPGTVVELPLMTIDWLPTIAALVGAALPEQKVDGKNILPILTGASRAAPHEALFFWYNQNELQAARWGDWKLYLPHSYRTLRGGFPGKDGQPGEYRQAQIAAPELYDLRADLSETRDVAAQHPDIVAEILRRVEAMREELGDSLTKKTGRENRPPWRAN